jgi:hypothetical protein
MKNLVDKAIADCKEATGYSIQIPDLKIGGSSTGSYTMHEGREFSFTAKEQCLEILENAAKKVNSEYGRIFKKNKTLAKKEVWPQVRECLAQLEFAKKEFCN